MFLTVGFEKRLLPHQSNMLSLSSPGEEQPPHVACTHSTLPQTGKSLCALSFAPALSPATCKPLARYGPTTGMLYAKLAIVLKNLLIRKLSASVKFQARGIC